MKILPQSPNNKISCTNILVHNGERVYRFNTPQPLVKDQIISTYTRDNGIIRQLNNYKVISNMSNVWIEEFEDGSIEVQHAYNVIRL